MLLCRLLHGVHDVDLDVRVIGHDGLPLVALRQPELCVVDAHDIGVPCLPRVGDCAALLVSDDLRRALYAWRACPSLAHHERDPDVAQVDRLVVGLVEARAQRLADCAAFDLDRAGVAGVRSVHAGFGVLDVLKRDVVGAADREAVACIHRPLAPEAAEMVGF